MSSGSESDENLCAMGLHHNSDMSENSDQDYSSDDSEEVYHNEELSDGDNDEYEDGFHMNMLGYLHQCVENEQLDDFKEFCIAHPNYNINAENGDGCLCDVLADKGWCDGLQFLLDIGRPRINYKQMFDTAMECGHIEFARIIMQSGSIFLQACEHDDILCFATKSGNPDVIVFLKENGLSPSFKSVGRAISYCDPSPSQHMIDTLISCFVQDVQFEVANDVLDFLNCVGRFMALSYDTIMKFFSRCAEGIPHKREWIFKNQYIMYNTPTKALIFYYIHGMRLNDMVASTELLGTGGYFGDLPQNPHNLSGFLVRVGCCDNPFFFRYIWKKRDYAYLRTALLLVGREYFLSAWADRASVENTKEFEIVSKSCTRRAAFELRYRIYFAMPLVARLRYYVFKARATRDRREAKFRIFTEI